VEWCAFEKYTPRRVWCYSNSLVLRVPDLRIAQILDRLSLYFHAARSRFPDEEKKPRQIQQHVAGLPEPDGRIIKR